MQTESATAVEDGVGTPQAAAAAASGRSAEPSSAWLREFALRIDRIEREFSVLRMKLSSLGAERAAGMAATGAVRD